MRYVLLLSLLVTAAAGCGSRLPVQCKTSNDCNEPGLTGGSCDVNPITGNQWCSYDDSSCASGRRWAPQDTGDGLQGLCVETGPDGGAPDAQPDAHVPDARPTADAPPGCVLKVAFHDGADGSREVWVSNLDGTGLINVSNDATHDDLNPSWSPDGTKIAFQSNRNGNWDIYVVDRTGSGLTNLTPATSTNETEPVWSPDGTKIAFNRGGVPYVMLANGSGVAQISTLALSSSIAWSPDSTQVVFGHVNPNVPDLFVATIGSSGQPVNITNEGNADVGATWAPGPLIAFYAYAGSSNVFTVSKTGTGLLNVTNNSSSAFYYAPQWTDDGQTIVFASDRENSIVKLFKAPASGSGPITRIVDNTQPSPGGDFATDVSTDGAWVTFEHRSSLTASQVGVVGIGGSNLHTFNGTSGTNGRAPSFSPCL